MAYPQWGTGFGNYTGGGTQAQQNVYASGGPVYTDPSQGNQMPNINDPNFNAWTQRQVAASQSADSFQGITDPNFAANFNSRNPSGYGGVSSGSTVRPDAQPAAGGFGMVGGAMQQAPYGGAPGAAPSAQANYGAPGSPGGYGAPASYGTGPANGGGNPYLQGQANALTTTATQNFQRNVLPSLTSYAMQGGGLGGSREGVIQANAANDMNTSLNNSLANLYGADWTNAQNRALTDQGQQNQFYLGNRTLDQNGVQLGANLFNAGMNGQWSPIDNAAKAYQPFTGLGTTTQNTTAGGGTQGLLGGGISGATFAHQMGWI